MNGFTVSAVLTRAAATSDGGISVGFHTKELPADEKLSLMKLYNQTGWLLFSPDPIQETAVPEKRSEFELKSRSQTLRGVIFVYWDKSGRQGEFEDFYRSKMNGFIEHVKNKIDELNQ